MSMAPSLKSYNNPLSSCACIATIDIFEDAWTSEMTQGRDCKRTEHFIKREVHLAIPCYCTFTARSEKEESSIYQITTIFSGSCMLAFSIYRCQGLPRPRSADAFALPFYSSFHSMVVVLQIP